MRRNRYEVVSTTAFSLLNGHVKDYRGGFIRLVDGQNEAEKARMLEEALKGQEVA